jgi:hypothetical protein
MSFPWGVPRECAVMWMVSCDRARRGAKLGNHAIQQVVRAHDDVVEVESSHDGNQ